MRLKGLMYFFTSVLFSYKVLVVEIPLPLSVSSPVPSYPPPPVPRFSVTAFVGERDFGFCTEHGGHIYMISAILA